VPVYSTMMFQIAADFPGIPNVLRFTLSEIRFWYNGERSSLKQRTKPRKK
jgi:hypothetical protein